MKNRRTALLTFCVTWLGLSVKRSDAQVANRNTSKRLPAIYLHVYSSHHPPRHDTESNEQRKPTFANPVWTRVFTIRLVPEIHYSLRCPNNRNPDISVEGKLLYHRDGTIVGDGLTVGMDDTNQTHQNVFVGTINLGRAHPHSDTSFRYIFSEDESPYVVLEKAAEHG
jgi:hypothetical protein